MFLYCGLLRKKQLPILYVQSETVERLGNSKSG